MTLDNQLTEKIETVSIKTTKQQYREHILRGKLPLPEQIIELVGEEHRDIMNRMFSSLWHNFMKNKGKLSIPYWSDEFDCDKVFNTFLEHLSRAGWIISSIQPKRNWGEFYMNEDKLHTFVSPDELIHTREKYKFNKYIMECNTNVQFSDITKLGKDKLFTGLRRDGFALAGNSKFAYDSDMILRYRNIIELNLTKSMDKLKIEYNTFKDDIDYTSVSKAILDHHISNPSDVFTTGENINDSRGRAISKVLAKVFNPISNKDSRSLLRIVPAQILDNTGIKPIYLFIAELLGYKPDSFDEKANLGRIAFKNRTFNELDPISRPKKTVKKQAIEDSRAEHDRDELHLNIWLERIYYRLGQYFDRARDRAMEFVWDIPLELDATASMLQVEGALLGHEPFLDKTNCHGDELKDMWQYDGLTRNMFKKVMTRILYGSSKTPIEIWKGLKIKYTKDQAKTILKEIHNGDMAVANEFKEFIISNVNPGEEMQVKVWNDTFTIRCNKFKKEADYVVKYEAFDTKTGRHLAIFHTHTHKVPDLDQFKRFFVTLLVFNTWTRILSN